MSEEINSYTTISVKPETKQDIKKAKKNGESYDEYIQSLLPETE